MNHDQSLHAELGGNVEGTHGLSPAGLETDHSVVWVQDSPTSGGVFVRFKVRVHNLNLGGTHGSGKCPSVGARGGYDVEGSGAPSGDPKLFGDVDEILGFAEHCILLDIPGIDKHSGDERFHSQFLLEFLNVVYRAFCDFVTVACDGG